MRVVDVRRCMCVCVCVEKVALVHVRRQLEFRRCRRPLLELFVFLCCFGVIPYCSEATQRRLEPLPPAAGYRVWGQLDRSGIAAAPVAVAADALCHSAPAHARLCDETRHRRRRLIYIIHLFTRRRCCCCCC